MRKATSRGLALLLGLVLPFVLVEMALWIGHFATTTRAAEAS